MTTLTYLYELHNIYKSWLNALSLADDEMAIFRVNLEKVLTANNKQEITAQVEQFQNQFITHLNELQMLRHDVQESEKNLEKNISDNPVAADHRKIEADQGLKERVQQFQKMFLDLKHNFNTFLSKTL
jgi:Asp-tRNA(Asn)/Glu-tRNA(Gln) amidotransferase C subunit